MRVSTMLHNLERTGIGRLGVVALSDSHNCDASTQR